MSDYVISNEGNAVFSSEGPMALDGEYTISCDAGSFGITGIDALLSRLFDAFSGDTISITGSDATLSAATSAASMVWDDQGESIPSSEGDMVFDGGAAIVGEFGSFTISGQDASLVRGKAISAEAVSVLLTGIDAEFDLVIYSGEMVWDDQGESIPSSEGDMVFDQVGGLAYSVTAESSSILLTGIDATFIRAKLVAANETSISITGTAAGILKGSAISAEVDAVSITGTAAGTLKGYVIAANDNSVAIVGHDVVFEKVSFVSAEVSSVSITGIDADIVRSLQVIAEVGTISITGIDIGAEKDSIISADASAVTITGIDAELNYFTSYYMPAAAVAVLITGSDATLETTNREIIAEAVTVTITGEDAQLLRALAIEIEAAAVNITGVDALFNRNRNIPADGNSYSITGIDVSFLRNYVFESESGTYSITGSDAGLDVQVEFLPHGLVVFSLGSTRIPGISMESRQPSISLS